MTDAALVEKLKAALGERIEIAHPAPRRLFIKVSPQNLVDVTTTLRDAFGVVFLSTISGVDLGATFEIVYHFSTPETDFNLRTEVPKDRPHVSSITSIIPGAILYERELQEMFGLTIDNIPDPRPLVLPDDWPAGNYPLRKDWKHERPQEVIPGGKS
jgi:NADH-quinone oxidoreductase subunit C